MRERPSTPIVVAAIIGIAIIGIGAFYYFVLSMFPGGGVLKTFVLVGTIGVLGALGYAAWQRVREIEEEDPDDYRKY